jgi:hypothetical protein
MFFAIARYLSGDISRSKNTQFLYTMQGRGASFEKENPPGADISFCFKKLWIQKEQKKELIRQENE